MNGCGLKVYGFWGSGIGKSIVMSADMNRFVPGLGVVMYQQYVIHAISNPEP